MKPNTAVIKEVDPQLRVISGHTRHKQQLNDSYMQSAYNTAISNCDDEWEKAAGVHCEWCGEESFILHQLYGLQVCKKCYNSIPQDKKLSAKKVGDGRIILTKPTCKGRLGCGLEVVAANFT